MAMVAEPSALTWLHTPGHGALHTPLCLTDKYDVLKDIGDGSFGSVVSARVRSAGAHIAKRGTLVSSMRTCSSQEIH